MPHRAKQICRAPGCGAACNGAYCPQHITATGRHRFDRERGSSSARGYGYRWKLLRRMVLARDLVCKIGVLCGGTALATEVDHIIPRSRGGDDSMTNLQGACHACHSHKTATEDSTFAARPPPPDNPSCSSELFALSTAPDPRTHTREIDTGGSSRNRVWDRFRSGVTGISTLSGFIPGPGNPSYEAINDR